MSARLPGLPKAALGAGLLLAGLLAASLGAPRRLLALFGPAHAPHQLDGRIAPGEYRFDWTDETSRLRFAWSIVGDRLVGAVASPDTGWVAVGFGGDGPLMYGADIVMGAADARGAVVRDHYADSPTDQHADTVVGGRNDILGGAGLQTDAGTVIEFDRPLAAHDSADVAIEAGETHIMLASADADDFAEYHEGGRKAVMLFDLFAGPPASSARSVVLPDHLTDVQIVLAVFAALFLVMGLHGYIESLVAQSAGHPPDAPVSDLAVVIIVMLMFLEVVSLGIFGAGVAMTAPTWALGLTLGLGLLALAGIVAAYSRVFVRWEVITRERDDGIPW